MPPLTVTDLGTILTVWAHPDDEAYLAAGLMASARAAGQRVMCVTATRGEGGSADPERWPAERLGRLRAAELRASLAALSVSEHRFLGYRDGTCASQDPDAAVSRIADVIDEVRPDTIVTFGPDGMTGHADHRAVGEWTTAARERTAPDARLLYPTTTPQTGARWRAAHAQVPMFYDDDLPVGTPLDGLAVHLELDDELADRKLVALRAQASQTMPLVAVLGEAAWRRLWTTESFRLADTTVVRRSSAAAGAAA